MASALSEHTSIRSSRKERRGKRPKLQAISTLENANSAIREIGQVLRRVERLRLESDHHIEQITAARAKAEQPYIQFLFRQAERLLTFATLHRKELTQNEYRKLFQFAHGVIRWRKSSPSVKLKKQEELIIADLKARGLYDKFVRVVESLDKNAILKEKEDFLQRNLPDVTISQRELFWIEPKTSKERLRHDPEVSKQPWRIERKKKY